MDNNELFNEIENEEEDGIITLVDDEGNEVQFAYVDLVEYEGENYAIMLPIEDGEVLEEAVVMLVQENEDGSDELTGIEDEAIVNAVIDIYNERVEEDEE
ncbi:MAG: DUF1292 domain-containing protein [Clostridia bacterium]|nr:DUF1292 domain-containing protein [Clostridia bacterium]MBQ2326688.1 DUF1292 domain-containing protein [Clostridia bacterium]MBQ5813095.1 DUF1292 domain-containing protein [Clostridia bacterium]